MAIVWIILLVVALAIGLVANLFAMPGNWLIVAATAIYAYVVPEDSALSIGNRAVVAIAVLAVLGELVELGAGALGVAKAGGSRRSAALALLGSLVGGVIGVGVGLPVPIVGSVLAAVLFAAVGALVGAMLGENWKGRNFDQGLAVGKAAFWGRLVGTVAKTAIGLAMVFVALVALVVP